MSMAEDTRYRSSYPRDEQGNDPLTELARLIGQNDPFADKTRRASAQLDAQEHRRADLPARTPFRPADRHPPR